MSKLFEWDWKWLWSQKSDHMLMLLTLICALVKRPSWSTSSKTILVFLDLLGSRALLSSWLREDSSLSDYWSVSDQSQRLRNQRNQTLSWRTLVVNTVAKLFAHLIGSDQHWKKQLIPTDFVEACFRWFFSPNMFVELILLFCCYRVWRTVKDLKSYCFIISWRSVTNSAIGCLTHPPSSTPVCSHPTANNCQQTEIITTEWRWKRWRTCSVTTDSTSKKGQKPRGAWRNKAWAGSLTGIRCDQRMCCFTLEQTWTKLQCFLELHSYLTHILLNDVRPDVPFSFML